MTIYDLKYVRDLSASMLLTAYSVEDILPSVAWTVEVTDAFETWWDALTEDERVSLDGMIHVLEVHGPSLGPPYSIDVTGSQHPELRQLRVPHRGRTLCVLYIPDEQTAALVLLTGTTTGTMDEPCPPEHIELADLIYRDYLAKRGGAH